MTAVAAGLILDLEPLPALLLGSTVAATDAAAVFAVLRGSTLRRRLARTLEGESGINDPIAILLVIGCIEAIQEPAFGLLDAALLAVQELGIGFVVGLAIGFVSVPWLRHVRLPSAGLYPVASVATAALAYGAADTLHGSGFLVRLPRRPRARHRRHARRGARSSPSTTAWRGSPSWRCS